MCRLARAVLIDPPPTTKAGDKALITHRHTYVANAVLVLVALEGVVCERAVVTVVGHAVTVAVAAVSHARSGSVDVCVRGASSTRKA